MTFTKFFCNLHDILHEAFRPDVVRRGWADAGIYPFDVERIMSGWNHGATQANKSWAMLETEYKEFCLIAIEKLRVPARLGQLLDDVIENVIVRDEQPGLPALTLLDAMILADAGDPEYMKVQITGAMELLCSCMFDSCAGKTAVNHNRCLHLTAAEFLGRVRAANAQQEDFDAVVSEFGLACPCKQPPLKSKGKTHLGTAAHKKAFDSPDGQFFGLTVRQALERIRSSNIILVAGAAPLPGNDGNDSDVLGADNVEVDQYNEMDTWEAALNQDFEDEQSAKRAALDDGEDVTGIVPEDE